MRKEVATGGMKCSTPLRRAWLKKMLGCFESEMKVAADDEVGWVCLRESDLVRASSVACLCANQRRGKKKRKKDEICRYMCEAGVKMRSSNKLERRRRDEKEAVGAMCQRLLLNDVARNQVKRSGMQMKLKEGGGGKR